MTTVAILAIPGATIAGLWLLSYACLSQPTSPLNLSDWECGGWSTDIGLAIIAAGVIAMVFAWRAINRRSWE